MDCRDFKVENYPKDRNYLAEMFRMQKNLLNEYTKIEALPPYPVDLNTKDAQVLLKDFNARIVEELGEAMESYLIILENPEVQHDEILVKSHLSNFNEELADAMHFFLELLIYSGINERFLIPTEYPNGGEGDLGIIMRNLVQEFPPVTNLVQNNERIPHFQFIEDEVRDPLLSGGRVWNKTVLISMKNLLWDVTYYLQMARNMLKNKPWKQSGMLTDENRYQSFLGIAFVSFIEFYVYQGVTAREVFEVYSLKNQVNRFRQESKY